MVSYDAKVVQEKAAGKWGQIASDLAPDLQPALDANHRHVPCPIHGGTDGFRLFPRFDDSGAAICNTCGCFSKFKLLMEVNKWDFSKTVNEVGALIGASAVDGRKHPTSNSRAFKATPVTKQAPKPNNKSIADYRRKLDYFWGLGVSVGHQSAEPLRKYWQSRGLSKLLHGPCDDVRFVRRFKHPSGQYFPAKFLAIRNKQGDIVNLHRTYLTSDGQKAGVENPRLMMKIPERFSIAGSAIRYGTPIQGVLSVAEGFENAGAVYCATGLNCWSAVTANMLKRFKPPESVHTVLIWCDKDILGVGDSAALELCQRLKLEGLSAFIIKPKGTIPQGTKGLDWNQVWQQQGSQGFPSGEHLWRYLNAHRSPDMEAYA
ncbi:Zinc-binding domain of primase-helicase [Pseudovibrio sp. Ad37]|nr:Zinc-binding domain of primase-helicase [Pseudovibrio sp. Ad37]